MSTPSVLSRKDFSTHEKREARKAYVIAWLPPALSQVPSPRTEPPAQKPASGESQLRRTSRGEGTRTVRDYIQRSIGVGLEIVLGGPLRLRGSAPISAGSAGNDEPQSASLPQAHDLRRVTLRLVHDVDL